MIELEIPLPPSINTYYRRVGNKTLISKRGREFRRQVQRIVLVERAAKGWTDRLRVVIDIHAPDQRIRDIDNYCKAGIDALEKSGVFLNDSQIDDLRIRRRKTIKGGCAVVTIRKLNGGVK